MYVFIMYEVTPYIKYNFFSSLHGRRLCKNAQPVQLWSGIGDKKKTFRGGGPSYHNLVLCTEYKGENKITQEISHPKYSTRKAGVVAYWVGIGCTCCLIAV